MKFFLKLWFGDSSKFSNYGVCKLSLCSHKNRAISTKLKILEFKTECVYFIFRFRIDWENLVSDQQMLPKCKSLEFKRKKNHSYMSGFEPGA